MKYFLLLMMALPTYCADDLPGTYAFKMREVGSELLLKVGGQFEFMFVYGAADYMAEGSWKRDGDFVVLNTSGKKTEGFRLLSSSAGATDSIRVLLKGPGGQKVPNIDVVAVGTAEVPSKASTDNDGIALLIPIVPVKSIGFSIPVYNYKSPQYPVNPAHREFVFEINGPAITTLFFENERLRINGNSLELLYFNKDVPMKYTKN